MKRTEFWVPRISGRHSVETLGLPGLVAEMVCSQIWGLEVWEQHECGSKNSSWSFLTPCYVLLDQVPMTWFYPGALEGIIYFFLSNYCIHSFCYSTDTALSRGERKEKLLTYMGTTEEGTVSCLHAWHFVNTYCSGVNILWFNGLN